MFTYHGRRGFLSLLPLPSVVVHPPLFYPSPSLAPFLSLSPFVASKFYTFKQFLQEAGGLGRPPLPRLIHPVSLAGDNGNNFEEWKEKQKHRT